jgi:hypothetical protein
MVHVIPAQQGWTVRLRDELIVTGLRKDAALRLAEEVGDELVIQPDDQE